MAFDVGYNHKATMSTALTPSKALPGAAVRAWSAAIVGHGCAAAALAWRYRGCQPDDELQARITAHACEVSVAIPTARDVTFAAVAAAFEEVLRAQPAELIAVCARVGQVCVHIDDVDHDRTLLSATVDTSNGLRIDVSVSPSASFFAVQPRVAGHYERTLKAIAADDTSAISSIEIIGSDEADVLRRFSGQAFRRDLAAHICLFELFDATVDGAANRPALTYRGIDVTYAELEADANRIARHLRCVGVRTGDKVSLWLPRGLLPYAAILGAMKAGAAYVPIDPAFPADRARFINQDAAVSAMITVTELGGMLDDCEAAVVLLDRDQAAIEKLPATRLSASDPVFADDRAPNPSDPAYVIYTSGSTGVPKGVQISHSAAANLVRASHHVYDSRADDRVFQGFSLAFDASIEELWLAFYMGGTLVVGDADVAMSGPELAGFLRRQRVTAWSTVPTQLSMMQDDVPSLRLLILGGEFCPTELLRRWYRPDRLVVNTYGPTEATVIATHARCHPDDVVTIGVPVPNYRVFLLDEAQRPVPLGCAGEICIAGPGLADGYVGRDELNATCFVAPPFEIGDGLAQRVYRSGDVGRYDDRGRIQFEGRVDNQVKIRGYRVELSEIESILLGCDGVAAAVVTVREEDGIKRLVAYLVAAAGAALSASGLRATLRDLVPGYMVPSVFAAMDELPSLPSGKVDRRRLPPPEECAIVDDRSYVAPRNATERVLQSVITELLGPSPVCIHDDFFDLGGHSLLAARAVSRLRNEPGMDGLSIEAIYRFPTIAELAVHIDKTYGAAPVRQTIRVMAVAPEPERRSIARAAAIQAAALYPLLGLFSLALLVPWLLDRLFPAIDAVAWLVASGAGLLALPVLLVAVSIATKWALIGRFEAGQWPLWSGYYLRFWFVCRVVDLVPMRLLRGTPWMAAYLRWMGADIGPDVHIDSDRFRAFDLVRIGAASSIGGDAHMMAYEVRDGILRVGPISVGDGCFVGARSVVSHSTRLEDSARLGELSLLRPGQTVPAGDYWHGAPARAVAEAPPLGTENAERSTPTIGWYGLFAVALAWVLAVPVIAVTPTVWLMFEAWVSAGLGAAVAASLPGSWLFVACFLGLVAATKWIVLGRIEPGAWPVHSTMYIRKWLVDALVQSSLMVVQPIYGTIWLPPWLRMMGARIGRRAEISTVDHLSTDLLEVGDESFIADSVSVGPQRVHNGVVAVGGARIGRRSFVGNSALLPASSDVPSGQLVGLVSRPPDSDIAATSSHLVWLGSPPMALPRRQKSASFADEETFHPPRHLVFARGIVELFKIGLPPALSMCVFVISYFVLAAMGNRLGVVGYVLAAPLVVLFAGIFASGVVVAAKWALVGKYVERNLPLWHPHVWLSELINALWENVTYPFLSRFLLGTPWMAPLLRAMGSRIGKGVYIDTIEVTEFDLVDIDDHACINYGATVQTHLFEDRVMKMAGLHIGNGATIGPMAVALYGSVMGERACLDGLSLLMKGESLPARTRWAGSPAQMVPYVGV